MNPWVVLMWACFLVNVWGALTGSIISLIFAVIMGWILWDNRGRF